MEKMISTYMFNRQTYFLESKTKETKCYVNSDKTDCVITDKDDNILYVISGISSQDGGYVDVKTTT